MPPRARQLGQVAAAQPAQNPDLDRVLPAPPDVNAGAADLGAVERAVNYQENVKRLRKASNGANRESIASANDSAAAAVS
jgi:hypothetical protein